MDLELFCCCLFCGFNRSSNVIFKKIRVRLRVEDNKPDNRDFSAIKLRYTIENYFY